MLDRGQRPSWSELPQSTVDTPARELNGKASAQAGSDVAHEVLAQRPRPKLVQPRLIVALLLILGGLVWAVARGLHFYGLSPINAAYDLDQPPLILVLVGAWTLYRNGRG